MDGKQGKFGEFHISNTAGIDEFYNNCKKNSLPAVWIEKKRTRASIFFDLATLPPALDLKIRPQQEKNTTFRLEGVFLAVKAKAYSPCRFGYGHILDMPLPLARLAADAISKLLYTEIRIAHRRLDHA